LIQAGAESLDNLGVLVTRPAHQAEHLLQLLQQAGARGISFPAMEIRPAPRPQPVLQRLQQLEQYDWLIFISANAVDYGVEYLQQAGKSPRQGVAAIGRSTAEKLARHGIQVSLQPASGFNSEALLNTDAMSESEVRGKHVLIFRGQGGRELLADTLRSRGATVDYVEVYQRCRPQENGNELNGLWDRGDIQIVTVTSNEALKNLYDMLDGDGRAHLLNTPLVVPGERAAELARQLGFRQSILVAADATDQAMLARIRQWHNS
jgi:uroporphyrinogen-III synthase